MANNSDMYVDLNFVCVVFPNKLLEHLLFKEYQLQVSNMQELLKGLLKNYLFLRYNEFILRYR